MLCKEIILISWWLFPGEDAEEDEGDNPFSSIINPENEQLYIDDPKKALKGYFEREGMWSNGSYAFREVMIGP